MKRKMDPSALILLTLVAVLGVVAYARNPELPFAALESTRRLLGNVWLELALGFLLAGLIDVLIPADQMVSWIRGSGTGKAILAGWLVGLILPGGPYVFFPLAARLFEKGVPPGALIALLCAKTLVSPIRLLTYEAPLLGWRLTLVRLATTLFVPPLAGLLAERLYGWLLAR